MEKNIIYSSKNPWRKKNRIDELLEELKTLFTQQQLQALDHWRRSLPFADYIVDRWQKAKRSWLWRRIQHL